MSYLQYTIDYELRFKMFNQLILQASFDYDWKFDFDDKKSTTGYMSIWEIILFLGFHRIKKLCQEVVCCNNLDVLLLTTNNVIQSKMKHFESDSILSVTELWKCHSFTYTISSTWYSNQISLSSCLLQLTHS